MPRINASTFANALESRGYRVRRPATMTGQYYTSTAICHGGDSLDKLSFAEAQGGGFVAFCFTADCHLASPAEFYRRLKAAAGFSGGDYYGTMDTVPYQPVVEVQLRNLDAAPAGVRVPGWFLEQHPLWHGGTTAHHYQVEDKPTQLQTVLVVVRMPQPGGGKEIRRVTWNGENKHWQWGNSANAIVPLYRGSDLPGSHKPVLIVEGEKAVDVGRENPLLADYDIICPLGGSNPAKHTEWEILLHGPTRIYILGDNDIPGRTFANKVYGKVRPLLLRAGNPAFLSMLDPVQVFNYLGGEGEPPVGWDIADA